MNKNLKAKLRASLVAVSTASLGLVVSAVAQEYDDQGQTRQQSQKHSPGTLAFSKLDQNQDQKLTHDELAIVAEQKGTDVEQYMSQFDQDSDEALNEREFQQLKEEVYFSPDMVARIHREIKGHEGGKMARHSDGADIVVDQQPAQIVVDKPAPKIVVEQAKPKITVATEKPDVQVEQSEPQVSVKQPEPKVNVEQAQPEVAVRDAEPDVRVRSAEPEVTVREQEPEVAVRELESEPETSQQQQQEREMQQQQMTQQTQGQQDIAQREQEGQQAQAAELDVYKVPVAVLRTAVVADIEGEKIGNVEDVLLKRDGSEAGFIISTVDTGGQPRYVYRSAEDFSMGEGNKLTLNEEDGAEALLEPQGFSSREYVAAPRDDQGTIDELLGGKGLTAR